MRAAEALALPSHIENFGITVAEALACGRPALISKGVNIWREIESDGAGLVADAGLEGTVSLLERWLALPDEARCEMSDNARRSFAERYELERFAHEFVRCIEAS